MTKEPMRSIDELQEELFRSGERFEAHWPPIIGECYVCGFDYEPLLQIHHIVPKAKGGDEAPSNLVPLCPTCHALAHETMRRFDPLCLKYGVTWYQTKVTEDAWNRFNLWAWNRMAYDNLVRLNELATGNFRRREQKRLGIRDVFDTYSEE